jgi:hypothetical protein
VEHKNDRIERLNRQMEDMPEEARVRELRRQAAELEDQVEERNSRIAQLERRVSDLRREDWETAPDRLTSTLLSGFAGGSPAGGTWQRSGSRLTQSDAGQLFAKYIVGQNQNSAELLYQFSGSASGTGWRGYGLHFLASGSERSRGYGYGTSYLVWLTRDPAHYQSDRTYVQLYRSYSDVRMVEVASRSFDTSLGSTQDVGVYVDRGSGSLTVTLNGDLAFTYRDPEMIRSGRQLAVRTLGTATVRNLEVSTR